MGTMETSPRFRPSDGWTRGHRNDPAYIFMSTIPPHTQLSLSAGAARNLATATVTVRKTPHARRAGCTSFCRGSTSTAASTASIAGKSSCTSRASSRSRPRARRSTSSPRACAASRSSADSTMRRCGRSPPNSQRSSMTSARSSPRKATRAGSSTSSRAASWP